MSQSTAPYGRWDSLITSDTVTSDNIVFDDVIVDPVNNDVYYIEERPANQGRCMIVKGNEDLLPLTYSARDSVQEYGGSPAAAYGGIVYFSNDSTDPSTSLNAIYSLNEKSEITLVTPDDSNMRYANFAVHPTQTNLLVVVREDHSKGDESIDVVNTLCVVDTNTATVTPLLQGADFYAAPVFNSTGNKIGWQEWWLPDMPFEGGLIYVADVAIENGQIVVSNSTQVAGEKTNVSACYPGWLSDTKLVYTSDGGNQFQNPFIYDTETGKSTLILKTALEQDFCEPAWTLGLYPYAILGGGKYGAFTAFENGRNILYIIDLDEPSDPVQITNFDYTVAQHLRTSGTDSFVFTGIKSTDPGGVIQGTVSGESGAYTVTFTTLKASGTVPASLEGYISAPEARTVRQDPPLYVVYYAPKNPQYTGSSIPGEKPPCIVNVHGGPTALEPQALNWTKMYYTSRGFAWLDVNYRGSSGYGRAYIELLAGEWGVYDIADCQDAASLTSDDIDITRVAVRGGSAGGYATIASLTIPSSPNLQFYKAATSAYGGITDLLKLAQVTEKFELQYMWKLLGGSPDQIPDVYKARSPFYNVTDAQGNPTLVVPLLMLQGDEDPVVPPSQAHEFLTEIATEASEGYIAWKFYPGEGHHYHQKTTIVDALEREASWYQRNLV